MPLQWRNQIWQSLEEGAGKRCWECAFNPHLHGEYIGRGVRRGGGGGAAGWGWGGGGGDVQECDPRGQTGKGRPAAEGRGD